MKSYSFLSFKIWLLCWYYLLFSFISWYNLVLCLLFILQFILSILFNIRIISHPDKYNVCLILITLFCYKGHHQLLLLVNLCFDNLLKMCSNLCLVFLILSTSDVISVLLWPCHSKQYHKSILSFPFLDPLPHVVNILFPSLWICLLRDQIFLQGLLKNVSSMKTFIL